MAKLVFIDARHLGKSLALAERDSIGKARGNTHVLPDPDLRDRHATIAQVGGVYRISRAEGEVHVNGQAVAEHPLRHGDVVSLGAVTLLFSDDRTPSPGVPVAAPDTTSRVLTRSGHFSSSDAVVSALRKGRRVSDQLETLYRVTSALGSAASLPELLDQLIDHLFGAFGSDRCFVLLFDGEGKLEARRERMSPAATGTAGIPQALLDEAIRTAEALLVEKPLDDPRFESSQSIRELRLQSALGAPLVRGGRVMGIIEVDTVREGRTYKEEDLHLLNAIAGQAAIAIENLRQREADLALGQCLLRLGEGSRLLTSSLSRDFVVREAVERACRIFECTKATVMLLDETGGLLAIAASSGVDRSLWPEVRVRPGEGLAGRAILEGRTLASAGGPLPPGARGRGYETASFVVAPIVSRGEGLQAEARCAGALCVTDKASKGPFTARDQELVSIFASQVGIALNNARLFERATVDGLTRVFTRQYFNVRLEEEVAAHRSRGGPLSLVMCDLDHFKSKNDAYGHAAGDVILTETGGLLKSLVPPGAFAARFGGEEFSAILPGVSLDAARGVAEQVRRAVETHAFSFDGQAIRCTMSLGVGLLEAGDTPLQLVKRADSALYAAKHSGRNRVECAAGGPDAGR